MRLRERLFPIDWHFVTIFFLVLVAIAPAVLMWHWVSTSWVPLPFWDEWHTPGSQFESWRRGTLTVTEMFSQHNESRLFFSRLLYFTLAHFGGWDVRKEIRIVYFGVCALALLLLHLLRRTPGSTPASTLVGWTMMMGICFAPVQVENFLYGIEIETFFPGFALLAVAAINLARLSFRAKTLLNLGLAFVATYSFANGMLLWVLAWPLPSPNEPDPRVPRAAWLGLYILTGAISIGCYFIGYHRPSYHPKFVSPMARFWDLAHYIVLWSGNYFASDLVSPFLLGLVALSLFAVATGFVLWTIWQRRDWRTFYPWLLLGAFSCATVVITALGRLGFGVEQALDNRYVAFSRFFYIALFGLVYSIYLARIRSATPGRRKIFLAAVGCMIGLVTLLWAGSYEKFAGVPSQHRRERRHLLRALEWMEPIPDNPDLALILPFPDVLRSRAQFLAKEGILRLPFISGRLASAVRQAPPASDGARGVLDAAQPQPDGELQLSGWAWLPERQRPADCVVIGCEDAAGVFKPLTVLETGRKRPDLRGALRSPRIYRAGFSHVVKTTNFPPGPCRLKGWAIDLHAQKAWPLASSIASEGTSDASR